ncbi:hypothetical protein MSAN_01526000 [Mycena sanguinolenta]|uniref:Uncharacterized protein n=1 Tax=Mycena sanguinolenta TaxID=230812 RepID=A0A8H6Y7Q1_9AGAR|nr:hypothetical protein MSAN_01526000 [Mycena sanguinolenta]
MGAPSTPTLTRSQSWMALAAEVSHLPSIPNLKIGAVSLRKRFRSSSVSTQPSVCVKSAPTVASPRQPQFPLKSALKRPSPTRRASCPSYLTSSSSTFDIDESISSDNEKYTVNSPEQGDAPPSGSPTLKIAAHALLDRVRQIQIFTPSPPHRRVSRVFPDLPPAPDLGEVSITLESDDSDDETLLPSMTRKVRFVVPAPPPPPTPEPEWEEPAWCDFM